MAGCIVQYDYVKQYIHSKFELTVVTKKVFLVRSMPNFADHLQVLVCVVKQLLQTSSKLLSVLFKL